ncbi:hypothetical protein [Mesobacillus harenae]|uniref:hypothetical protein n=1 Tax=Mesobacillus harenae TaxID=2213203 RepID=UPI001580EB44|nr:hypothetical protein [Mesobacillus harenae]
MLNLKDLQMELIQLNESIDMMTTMLNKNNDQELVDKLEKLLKERKEIIKKIERLQ